MEQNDVTVTYVLITAHCGGQCWHVLLLSTE